MRCTECHCPTCGANEIHPTEENKILIRGLKVHDGQSWCSQCLVCSGYYDKNLNETPDNHNPEMGWYYEHEQKACQ